MEKLKEIIEKLKSVVDKLKNTEIKLKKPSLESLGKLQDTIGSKTKKFNLKDFQLKDLKNIDVKEFYNRYKQQILTTFVVVVGIFFLFYWTSSFLDSQLNSAKKNAENDYKKLERVATMILQVKQAEQQGVRTMNQGLLTFIQETGTKNGISAKLVNIRPITAKKGIEHVSLRVENLYYDEFIKFISDIETYDNLNIKVINFTKRYDNPKMIDSSIEVVKM